MINERKLIMTKRHRRATLLKRLFLIVCVMLLACINVCLWYAVYREVERFASVSAAEPAPLPSLPEASATLSKNPALLTPQPEAAEPTPPNTPSPQYGFQDSMLEIAAKQAAGMDQNQIMTLYDAENLVRVIQVIGNLPFPANHSYIINDSGGYEYYSNGIQIRQRGSIASLGDLRSMSCLRELYLSFQSIESLQPISSLQLVKLDIDNNFVTDLSPLSGMTTLKELYLSANPIQSIEALAPLTSLERLDVSGTQIEDVYILKNLTNLNMLVMRYCPVTWLPDLSDLTSLDEASFAGSLLEDFTPIKEHKGWRSLDVSFTQIENPLDLLYPSELAFLNIGGTGLETLSGIERFPNLEELWIHNTKVNSLSGVEALKKLEKLHMHYTEIEDITPLAALENLSELDIGYSPVKDLTPLLENRKRPLTIICPGLPESVTAPMVGQPNIILDK